MLKPRAPKPDPDGPLDPSKRRSLKQIATAMGTAAVVGANPSQLATVATPVIKKALEVGTATAGKWLPDDLMNLMQALRGDLSKLPWYDLVKNKKFADKFTNIFTESPSRDSYNIPQVSNFEKIAQLRKLFSIWFSNNYNFNPVTLDQFLSYELFSKAVTEDLSYQFYPEKKLTEEGFKEEKEKFLKNLNLKETNTVADALAKLEKLAEKRYDEYVGALYNLNLESFDENNLDDLWKIFFGLGKFYVRGPDSYYERGEFLHLFDSEQLRERYQKLLEPIAERIKIKIDKISGPAREKEEKARKEKEEKELEERRKAREKEEEEYKKEQEKQNRTVTCVVKSLKSDSWKKGDKVVFLINPRNDDDGKDVNIVAVRKFLEHHFSESEKIKAKQYYLDFSLDDATKTVAVETDNLEMIDFLTKNRVVEMPNANI